MSFRITIDVGGTFTDAAMTDNDGRLFIAKAPTFVDRGSTAIFEALKLIGDEIGRTVSEILKNTDIFVYSTTRATNAIIERRTAKTAFLTTSGFPDILVRREGGRANAFDYKSEFPRPYIPRELTFEVSERINADGGVVQVLDEDNLTYIIDQLHKLDVQAAAVCLLWSVINPIHELKIGERLTAELPNVCFTLSHQLWPALREYRRASATAIDASLKPLMTEHLQTIQKDLSKLGFSGELFGATSFGGVMYLDNLSRQPIYTAKSGPSLAPVAGKTYASSMSESLNEATYENIIVCDTGGTSFDVSLVRDSKIILTSETWIGGRFVGELIPTSSVDARSIGSGGGSIARIDDAGLLHVGPESAGANPGPACYGRGGENPTLTDAAAVLGYLDPASFMGGRLSLNLDSSNQVLATLGKILDLNVEEMATAILLIANEQMIGAIRNLTVQEGLDPRECLMIAGGGASGMTIGAIAHELGIKRVLFPRAAPALSAVGGLYSDIVTEFRTIHGTTTTDHKFDIDSVRSALNDLQQQANRFADELRLRGLDNIRYEFFAEARYAFQVWTLAIPVDAPHLIATGDYGTLSKEFDKMHLRLYAVAEPGQTLEVLGWRVRVIGIIPEKQKLSFGKNSAQSQNSIHKNIYFADEGWILAKLVYTNSLVPGQYIKGPALIVDEFTTLLVSPSNGVKVLENGDYILRVSP